MVVDAPDFGVEGFFGMSDIIQSTRGSCTVLDFGL